PEQHVDGVSFQPLLTDPAKTTRDVLFWHFPHWFRPHLGDGASQPCGAIREGDWKLFDFFEDGRLELYHVGGGDIGEKENVADQQPELCRRMLDRLRKWRLDSGVLMPSLK
ncbi:MAG: sulfatase, partial [Lentisphaerae bacterium]|nr:sulfatase [Lentisphaerota bacterium]